MQVKYEELIQEIEEITTVDGFVASCLEIKESMFFYDCDLMLAAFSASLELLAGVALFSAALRDKKELNRVAARIVRCTEQLLAELTKYRLPLDIQHVVDRFLQDSGLQINLRMPVYIEMVRHYSSAKDNNEVTIDALLLRAHRCLAGKRQTKEGELTVILGQIGRKMLRGAHLRPIWLEISHPRIYLVLVGLQTMMNNFKVTPYFNFPLEEIGVERQKRKKVKGNVVLDLGVVRNFREGGSGYTDLNIVLAKDNYDQFLEAIFSGQEYLDVEPDQQLFDLIEMVFEIRLVNSDIENYILLKLLDYCRNWKVGRVCGVISEILSGLSAEDPLFNPLQRFLETQGGRVSPAAGATHANSEY